MNKERSDKPRLALIAGPTASGKSALALAIARQVNGTIINADASQVYADIRILSARPTLEDEASVPHRLFGTVDAAEAYSAARWAQDARDAIAAVRTEDRLPILVGGSGLYIRTLLDGIAPVPEVDPDIRAAVRALPVAEAHARLTRVDPFAAGRLAVADTTRVARALEVALSTGRPLAEWQAERSGGIADQVRLLPLILTPDRHVLATRIAARAAAMLDGGAVEEVKRLLARRLDPQLPAMRAIGVREVAALVAGHSTREDAVAEIANATRRYAKRQGTWFRHQTPPSWLRIDPQEYVDSPALLARKLLELA